MDNCTTRTTPTRDLRRDHHKRGVHAPPVSSLAESVQYDPTDQPALDLIDEKAML